MVGAIFQGIGASIEGVASIVGTVDDMNHPDRALNIEKEKTERARIEAEAEMAKIEAENRKNKILIVLSSYFILVLIAAFIVYKSYKKTN